MEEIYTLQEAAQYLKISEKTLYRARKKGEIKFLQFGDRVRFKESHLIEYLKKCERVTASQTRLGLRLPAPPSVCRR